MNKPSIEHRIFKHQNLIASDIAHHLLTQYPLGKIAVINSSPRGFLPHLKRQWLKVEHSLQRERSSTLDINVIQELTKTIHSMKSLSFSTYQRQADVYCITLIDYICEPFACHTIYATEEIDDVSAAAIARGLQDGGLLVRYHVR